MTAVLRRMEDKDLDQVMAIEAVSFPAPWSRDSYRGELANQFATYYVVEENGQILGYAGVWCVFEEAHVTNVAVKPEARRRGWGRKLMQKLIETAMSKGAQRIYLEVRPSNLPAINLYRSLGFVPGGLRRGYYTDNNEDALILVRLLLPETENYGFELPQGEGGKA